MTLTNLSPILLTKLKVMYHPKGNILHALKASEDDYCGFEEAYFSTILYDEIKGWKKHHVMHMNLIVPIGMVRFYVYDEANNSMSNYLIGIDNYCRLSIPPGYWVAFKGCTSPQSLLLNIANLEHDPMEATNVDINSFPIID